MGQIEIVAQWVEMSKNADSNIGIIGDETLGCCPNGFLGCRVDLSLNEQRPLGFINLADLSFV